MAGTDRDLDLIVFGATSFVGQILTGPNFHLVTDAGVVRHKRSHALSMS